VTYSVIPAHAGIQGSCISGSYGFPASLLDSRLHGNEEGGGDALRHSGGGRNPGMLQFKLHPGFAAATGFPPARE
jgi:hypothetical protein